MLKVSLPFLAEKGDLAAIKAELRKHPNAKNERSHDKGMHALTAAVIKKHYDIAKYLLENFVEVDLVDRGGDTALLHACNIGDAKMVELLLSFGADVNAIGHTSKNTPLFEAISHSFLDVCSILLDHPGLDLSYKSELGADTALTLASEAGMYEVVEALIEKGADLNATNHWKSTPLIVAIKKGHFEVAKLLARSGADIHHKDSSGMDSLEYLKHNQEQLVALTACEESGRAQADALQRLSKDEDLTKTIASMGELQKMNVAVYMCRHWGVNKIDQALRITNMVMKPIGDDSGDRIENETPNNQNRRSRVSYHQNSPMPDLGIKSIQRPASSSNHGRLSNPSIPPVTTPSIAANSPAGNGRAAAKAIASSESLPALRLPGESAVRFKDNPLLVNLDCGGMKIPTHWINHLFVHSLKTDTYIRSIDMTGNDLEASTCSELVDILANSSRITHIRVGAHGLDFDLSKSPPEWYVDQKYFASCDIGLLSRILLAWPSLFVAEDASHNPAIFAGGTSSSRINPIVLEAFDEIASASDFHPSHLILPREREAAADDEDNGEEECHLSQGFILDIFHYSFWFHIISRDRFADLVKTISQDYPYLTQQKDFLNRSVESQASPECKKKITSAALIYDRYQIHNYKPKHHGKTSCMYFATDIMSTEKQPPKVALKFLKNKSHFEREVITRTKYKLDYEVILDCYPVGAKKKEFYDATSAHLGYERLRKFKTEMKRLSTHQESVTPIPHHLLSEDHKPLLRMQTMEPAVFERFPYCIVFPKADADLTQIMQHDMSESMRWETIRSISQHICHALRNMHELEIIHGDVRPINVMMHGRNIVLIDLDSSLNFSEYIGNNITPSYMPPEMVYLYKENSLSTERDKTATDGSSAAGASETVKWRAKVKQFPEDEKGQIISSHGLPYKQVKATPSYDIWAFGVLMYYMCMKENLWLENIDGNIRESDLVRLGLWTTQYKSKVLSRISNTNARNLIAQLLSKDPNMRPTANRILAHPFISGRSVARMVGEEAFYDVFISYRVKSERDFAAALYHELTKRGLKCYLDKFCLKAGVSWEQGFCDGLAQSLTFVPLLSRNAVNNPDIPRQNFAKLKEDSAIDNVFLEHRIALELEVVGLLEKISPVLIGDLKDGEYSNYNYTGCAPVFTTNADVVVHSVETKLMEHLDRLGLGTPIHENQSVKQVWDGLMLHQAVNVLGDAKTAILRLSESIVNMVADCKEMSKASALSRSYTMDIETEAEPVDLELDIASFRFDSDYALSTKSKDVIGEESEELSPALRAGMRSTLILSKDKRISELEEENKALKKEIEQLRSQLGKK